MSVWYHGSRGLWRAVVVRLGCSLCHSQHGVCINTVGLSLPVVEEQGDWREDDENGVVHPDEQEGLVELACTVQW